MSVILIDPYRYAAAEGAYTVTYVNTLANIRAIASATLGETAYATDTHNLYVYDGVDWTTFNNEPGFSIEFDGTDDFLAMGTSAIDLDTNFTISCWFKSHYHGGYVPIGGWGDFSAGKLRLMQILGGLSFEIWGNRVTGSTSITTNTWYHGAVTYSGNDAIVYLNGSQDGSGTISRTSYSSSTTLIGGHADLTASGFSEFDGMIDEFAVFDSVLSASQITSIYNSGAPGDLTSLSPVGWWKMGEGIGDTDSGGGAPANTDVVGTVVDQGSGGNNATTASAPIYSSDIPS